MPGKSRPRFKDHGHRRRIVAHRQQSTGIGKIVLRRSVFHLLRNKHHQSIGRLRHECRRHAARALHHVLRIFLGVTEKIVQIGLVGVFTRDHSLVKPTHNLWDQRGHPALLRKFTGCSFLITLNENPTSVKIDAVFLTKRLALLKFSRQDLRDETWATGAVFDHFHRW